MSETIDQLSPLDQIRQAEADVARRIAMAREASERSLAKARAQARTLLEEARHTGQREGAVQYRQIVSKAEEEARAIIAEADSQAGELRRKGHQLMDGAVRQVVNIIAGLEEEGTDQ